MGKWDGLSSQEKYARYAELANARLEEKRRAELDPRRDEGPRTAAERETYWLEQERLKYGLPKRARPISRMVA